MFESGHTASEKFEVPETLGLIQFLKALLVAQVIIVLILTMAASDRGNGGDAAALFVINGGLTLLKAVFIFAVIRALKRGSKAACYVVLAGAAAGLAYVLATFQPDPGMRYLRLEGFQYVVNVFNVIMAGLGGFLAVRTLRSLKALEAEGTAAAK